MEDQPSWIMVLTTLTSNLLPQSRTETRLSSKSLVGCPQGQKRTTSILPAIEKRKKEEERSKKKLIELIDLREVGVQKAFSATPYGIHLSGMGIFYPLSRTYLKVGIDHIKGHAGMSCK